MKQFRINIERDDINDVDIIEALSSIDSRFRVFDNSAEWIEKNVKIPGTDERTALMCSRCGILNFGMTRDDYCRHCGARMEWKDE